VATYYISAEVDGEEVVFVMNATTQARLSSSGELSQYRLESGEAASDHYRNLPDSISLSGVISDVVVQGGREPSLKSTKDYIEGLQTLKLNETPFTVHYASDLTPKYPCFFSELEISQDSDFGYAGYSATKGADINSYRVSASIEVARLGQLATIELAKASEFIDPTADKAQASSSTKEILPDNPADLTMIGGLDQQILGAEQALEGASGTNIAGGS